MPDLSIEWYAKGGILTKPTIFGMNGNTLMGGGEAGHEAILPIDRLQGYVSQAIEKSMPAINLGELAGSIEDLANRPIVIKVNGKEFARATAGDTDSVNGQRTLFRKRGLALE